MKTPRLARQRRHTLFFLDEIRSHSPVFIDTEIDMSTVQRHRREESELGRRISYVAYVVDAASRALAAHPEANVGLRGRLLPRVARYDVVNAKVTLDKTISGQRAVLGTVIPNADTVGLVKIQQQIDHYKQGDPDQMPEFAAVRLLHKLPWPVGRFAYSRRIRSLRHRHVLLGTLAVTSLGHRPVDGFQSVGGTTVTLGVGRILDRPVARGGQVVIAPVMRLSLAFDHRAIDGAEAADLLSDIKAGLEDFAAGPARSAAPTESVDARGVTVTADT